MPDVYKPSGKLSGSPVAVHIGGAVLAVAAGFFYALLDVFMPVAGLVTVLFTFAFGAAIGAGLNRVARFTHCRNRDFVALAGMLWGCVGLYVAWVAFEWLLLMRRENVEFSLFALATSPRTVWEVAATINETGWFTLRHITPSGAALWCIWAAEAGIVLYLAAKLAPAGIGEGVFCEESGQWCRAWKPIRLSLPEDPALLERVVAGEHTPFAALRTVDGTAYPRLNILVHEAPPGGTTHTWQVQRLERTAKGAEVTNELTGKFLATESDLESLRLVAGRSPAASAAADPDVPLLN